MTTTMTPATERRTLPGPPDPTAPVPTITLAVYHVRGDGQLRIRGTVDVTERGSWSARRELWRIVQRAQDRLVDDEHLAVTVEANGSTYPATDLPAEFGRYGLWRLPEPVIRFINGFRAGALRS